jgi:hypothetical protein
VTYEVVGVLGRGGMALVELAVDEHGNAVARKRIPLTRSARLSAWPASVCDGRRRS